MIAKVYPIRRLPAHAGPFDYIVPEGAHIGDLVGITFKGRFEQGVIWALEPVSEVKNPSSIESTLHPQFLTPSDIKRFDTLSTITAQSISSYLALLPLAAKKKTTPKKQKEAFTELHYSQEDIDFAKTNIDSLVVEDSAHMWPLHILTRIKKTGRYLIICPNDDIARLLKYHLSKRHETCVAGSGVAHAEEKELMTRWHSGKLPILIAVRHAALWPTKHIDAVFSIDEANPDYMFRPRNPRYDTRFAAYLAAIQHKAPLYRIGHAHTLTETVDQGSISCTINQPTIIDASKHPSEHPYFTLPVIEALQEAHDAGKGAILFLNKTGIATHFQCRSCGHLPTCGTCGSIPIVRQDDLICPTCHIEMWHPSACPQCGKKTLTKKGIGTEHVQDTLNTMFIKHKHVVVSELGMRNLEMRVQKDISCFIDLCADYHFLDESYACDEIARYKMLRFLHIARDHRATPVLIQAYQPERIRNVLSPDWSAKELEIRQKNDLPPYSIELTIRKEQVPTERIRAIDKTTLLKYLNDFRSLGRKDTIDIHPQNIAYERITSPK